MAKTPLPSSPATGSAPADVGARILVTATTSGTAQTVWTPSAPSTDRESVFMNVGTVHTGTVKLSVGYGGTALGQVFEQDVAPRSGLNPVLDWEFCRSGLGPIVVWADVGSVLSVAVYSTVER